MSFIYCGNLDCPTRHGRERRLFNVVPADGRVRACRLGNEPAWPARQPWLYGPPYGHYHSPQPTFPAESGIRGTDAPGGRSGRSGPMPDPVLGPSRGPAADTRGGADDRGGPP